MINDSVPVADVLKLSPLHFARPQRQTGRGPLERLDARHLVCADHTFPSSHARRRLSIHAAHVSDPLIALLGLLVGGGCQPVPNQMWFEIGLF